MFVTDLTVGFDHEEGGRVASNWTNTAMQRLAVCDLFTCDVMLATSKLTRGDCSGMFWTTVTYIKYH